MDESRRPGRPGEGFWGTPKPAAVLKHAILRSHLEVYAKKVGSTSQNGRVVYFDGYAGEGRYDDGSPGSPVLAAEAVRVLARLRSPRRLDAFLCEKDPTAYAKLTATVAAEAGGLCFEHRHGTASRFLGEAVAFARGAPLFAFLDPYGQGEPFATVVDLLNRSAPSHRPPTEVLINFSAFLVRRVDVNNVKKLRNIDVVCGGPWWRDGFLMADDKSHATEEVVRGYCERIMRATGCYGWYVAARNHQQHKPVYYLVFFTRHRDGFWLFGESVSLAMAKWRRYCWDHGPKGTISQEDFLPGLGQDLADLFEDQETKLEAQWTAHIRQNLQRMLQTGQAPFRILDRYTDVMGGATGLARSPHLRTAIKQLHQAGMTATTSKGDLDKKVILPPSR